MRIVYIAAGAGGMYCGSCLHDNTLAAAMRAQGDDMLLVATYTPIRTDEDDASAPPVHFGGINVFLQQWFPPFRWLPQWMDRWLNSSRLLRWLAGINIPVRAEKLGGLTLSMLRGEDGYQRKELTALVDWLAKEVRPDVVHLSNTMLAGTVRQITDRLDVPVVSSLTGEDLFIERLPPLYYGRVREELRRRAAGIARFVAFNDYYAEFMADYLAVDRKKISVIPHGLKLEGHGTRRSRDDNEFHVGYLARIAPEKGLHHLVDAFKLLADDKTLPVARLHIAGYLNSADRAYFKQQQAKLASWGLENRVTYHGEVTREAKIAFLQNLDVMSIPTEYREAKGLPVLEALANAVPVVLPEHGTFPELVTDTGGGLLCEPNNPADLARVLKQLMLDRKKLDELGRSGQQAVQGRYHDRLMAERHRAMYQEVLEEHRRARATAAEIPENVGTPEPAQ
jgi:glycosyltransferase involved in cell wall biosynthesis